MLKTSQLYHQLVTTLIQSNMTITTMESVTGGLIASLLTDTEGSSAILKGAFVTYSNEAKIAQGVSEEIIKEYGVYSQETAIAMARACRGRYVADLGIGVTGTLGNPDPANADSVPGIVHFAIDSDEGARSYTEVLPISEDRLTAKMEIAYRIGKRLEVWLQRKHSYKTHLQEKHGVV